MKIQDKIRRIKQLLEAMHSELDGADLEGKTVGLHFGFSSAKGEVSKSEALAFISAISRAVANFDEQLIAQLEMDFAVNVPEQLQVLEGVQKRMTTLIELEANGEAAKSKLVVSR
jgi:hypothetical protein